MRLCRVPSLFTIAVVQAGLAAQPEPPQVLRERPHQRAFLDPRWGDVGFPISCVRPESQDYFDQGVAQLHSDALFEAERSFRWVISAEPDCAMAWWGMAVANVHRPDRAALLLDRTVQLRSKVSAREGLFLDAWARFYEAEPAAGAERVAAFDDEASDKSYPVRTFRKDRRARAGQLARDLRKMVEAHPKDVEILAFYVRQLCANRLDGYPTRPIETIDAYIDRFIELNRRHPGHFYRVQLWARTNPTKAFAAAKFALVAATCSRAVWHHAGRLQAQLGRHDAAAHFFEAAARIDHARIERFWLMPFDIHGYAHNLSLLCQSLVRAGRFAAAREWARTMLAMPRHPDRNAVTDAGSLASLGAARFAEACHAAGVALDAAVLRGIDGDRVAAIRAVPNELAPLDADLSAGRAAAALPVLERLLAEAPGHVALLAREVAARVATADPARATVAFEKLRQTGAFADLDAPVFAAIPPFAQRLGIDSDWRHPPDVRVDLWPVSDLSQLGPRVTNPRLPREFRLENHLGRMVHSRDLRGRAHVVVFFIGNGCCLSCVPQLHLFNAQAEGFKAAEIDIAVVSFHTAQDVRDSMQKMGEHGFPFLLLADPRMRTWHEWLTLDPHDHQALFGTFLLDERGRVRWKDIGERPFEEPEWLLGEARRLLGRPAPATSRVP